jgi:hypothetical protein
MNRISLGLLLVARLAFAQEDPESEWAPPPNAAPQQLPQARDVDQNLPSEPPQAPAVPADFPNSPVPRLTTKPPRAIEPPNNVSVAGAPALGQWNRGEMISLGFPFLSLRGFIGITDLIDVGLGFDSLYFALNEFRLCGRMQFLKSDHWTLSGQLELGGALFGTAARKESTGARWITGRRNFNASPALVVSYRGDRPRASRLYAELRYTLAIDTEPFTVNPLDGVPANFIIGQNAGFKGGAEMPLSPLTSFVFFFGLDIHGRDIDSRVMPSVGVGIVTSI